MNPSRFGLILIIATLLIYGLCLFLRNKIKFFPLFKNDSNSRKLQLSLSRSIEEGKPIHLDVLNRDESQLINPSALVAMNTSEQLANRFAASDEPPFVTNNSGLVHALTNDAVKMGYQQADLENEFSAASIDFAGFDSLSHQTTMFGLLEETPYAMHLNIGSGGPEIALQDLMFQNEEEIYIAGDSLLGQATGLATADGVFIGEQLYELPIVTQPERKEAAPDVGLLVMDILRYGFIVALGIGALMILLV